MPGITVKGLDSAGGTQLAGGQSTFTVNGQAVVVKGDPVAGHGDAPHSGPVMAEGSSWMTWDGIPVVRAGHKATCGHAATGQSNWEID